MPLIAKLLASLPPLVKTISSGAQPRRAATCARLFSSSALAAAFAQGGLHWPNAPAGWWGLAALTALYGTALTSMFIVLPKLGVVGNAPILNVEPVAALVMAWAVLGQAISA